mgnify:CR=1 FL=1
MSELAISAAKMIDLLPEQDREFAYEFIKKLVLAWDPDYTKLTQDEEASMLAAENSGFINDEEIDWENIGVN